MGNQALQGGWGECVSGWMAGWVWVPSFVACTTLPHRRERERAEAAVTYHVNVSRAARGSLENSPFFVPPHTSFFKKKHHGVSEPQSDSGEGLCWMRGGRD